MKKLLVMCCLVVGIAGFVQARTPENLASTDIFPYEGIVIDIQRDVYDEDGKKQVEHVGNQRRAKKENHTVQLPLGGLNLSRGAEFFTIIGQAVYRYSALAKVKEVETERAGRLYKDTIHYFLADPFEEKGLAYGEFNPMAVLMRVLFNQVAGTSSLADFRVSQLAQKPTLSETLKNWAEGIAKVVKLYVLREQFRKVEHGKMVADRDQIKNRENFANFKAAEAFNSNFGIEPSQSKPSFTKLLLDCMDWADEVGLQKDFLLTVFMGGVYALAGHDRALIFNFYNELLLALPGEVSQLHDFCARRVTILQEDQEGFIQDYYSKQQGFAQGTEPMSFFAYKMLKAHEGAFSPLAYENAKVGSNVYADCFETTMRNVVLFLLQGIEDKQGILHHDFATFFAQYPTMREQALQGARNAWAAELTKIPGLWHVANRPELEPSLLNMLVVLNYVFELGIEKLTNFDVGGSLTEQAGQVSDANSALIQEMLPEVNTRLREKLLLNQEGDILQVNPKDVTDFSGEMINFTISKAGLIMYGYINVARHAEITRIDRDTKVINEENAVVGETPFRVLEYAVTGNFVQQEGSDIALFLAMLQAGITKPLEEKLIAMCRTNNKLLEMLLVAVHLIPDRREVGRWLISLGTALNNSALLGQVVKTALSFVEAGQARPVLELFDMLFERGVGFEQAIQVAVELSSSPYFPTKSLGIDLFQKLLKKEKGYREAIDQAVLLIKINHFYVSGVTLNLIQELLERGQGFEQLINVAVELINNDEPQLKRNGFRLFELLFANGQGFEQAAIAASEILRGSNVLVRRNGLELFDQLFQRQQGFEQAIAVVSEAFRGSDELVQQNGLTLFQKLFENGQGFEQASHFAAELLNNDSQDNRDKGYSLLGVLEMGFDRLLEKGQDFSQAITAAAKMVKSNSYDVSSSGIRLFEALVKKGKAFEQAGQIALEAVKSTSLADQGLALFKKLKEHNQGLEQAKSLLTIPEDQRTEKIKRVLELYRLIELPRMSWGF